jgi:ribosomal protein L39E
MPDHCKVPGDSVASYRKYYILEKRRFAKWEKPNAKMPQWFKEGIQYDTRR